MMNTHKENLIDLRNIRSLSGLNFYIPDYQRGYRWTSTQAKEMFNDFKDFILSGKGNDKVQEGYYCLQPVVVKPLTWKDKGGNLIEGYEVIDGQQRLTTIYLMLKALFCKDSRNIDDAGDFEMFSISYKTREDSAEYLENIGDGNFRLQKGYDCIDFYHIKNVFETFERELKNSTIINFDRMLLELILLESMEKVVNDDEDDYAEDEEDDSRTRLTDTAHNVRVIWYEIGTEEKATPEDIFTRLNIGKIPLTNAELIKAMFLKKSNFGKINAKNEKEQKAQQYGIALQQNKIAEEWNNIEQKLRRDDFWYFLGASSIEKEYETRIEFVFDLMADWKKEAETYHTFNYFQDCIKNAGSKKATENVWKRVKEYFRELEYWYNDRTLYHLIGFLIETGKTIKDIMLLREKTVIDENGNEIPVKLKKDEFLSKIEEEVAGTMKGIDPDTVKYPSDDIRKVLLLFTVLSVIENERSDIKFPFDRYKKENWDKEHIASQTNKDKLEVPQNNSKRIEWIDDMLYYFTGIIDKDAKDEEGRRLTDPAKKSAWVVSKVEEYIATEKKKTEAIRDKEYKEQRERELRITSDLLEAKELSGYTSKQRSASGQKERYDSLLNDLFGRMRRYFNEDRMDEEEKDYLGNMALLNSQINRSYGNAFFAIKRMHIRENDSEGVFIPLTTKNVFMKYYSKRVDNMLVWTNEDAAAYLETIKKKLSPFLKLDADGK